MDDNYGTNWGNLFGDGESVLDPQKTEAQEPAEDVRKGLERTMPNAWASMSYVGQPRAAVPQRAEGAVALAKQRVARSVQRSVFGGASGGAAAGVAEGTPSGYQAASRAVGQRTFPLHSVVDTNLGIMSLMRADGMTNDAFRAAGMAAAALHTQEQELAGSTYFQHFESGDGAVQQLERALDWDGWAREGTLARLRLMDMGDAEQAKKTRGGARPARSARGAAAAVSTAEDMELLTDGVQDSSAVPFSQLHRLNL